MKFKVKTVKLTAIRLVTALAVLFIADIISIAAQADSTAITASNDGEYRYTVDLAAAGGSNDIVATFEMDVPASDGENPINIIINNSGTAKYRLNRYTLSIEPDVMPFEYNEPDGYPRRFTFYAQNNYPGFGFNTFDEYSRKGSDQDFIRENLIEFIDENGAALVFNNTLGATQGNPYGSYRYTVTLQLYLRKTGLFTVTYDGNNNTGGIAPANADDAYSIGESVTVLYKGTLEKEGHEFLGWSTDKNADEAQYVPGDPAKGSFAMPPSNVVLYAIWRNTALPPKYSYTIRYYKDSLSAGNEISPAETSTAKYDENHLLTVAEIDNDFPGWLNSRKPAVGYQNGTLQSTLPLTITATESDNVLNVVYIAAIVGDGSSGGGGGGGAGGSGGGGGGGAGAGGGTTLAPLDNTRLEYEIIDDNGTPLGKWSWDEETEKWIYDEYPPLSSFPQTGSAGSIVFILGLSILAAGTALLIAGMRKRAPKRSSE